MRLLTALLFLVLSCPVLAESDNIALNELGFLDQIQAYDKPQILDLLGEPSDATDIRNLDTGDVVGAIWHYHYLNTSEDGDYYKTTELDFVGDRVVMVVFINTDDGGNNAAAVHSEAAMPVNSECTATC